MSETDETVKETRRVDVFIGIAALPIFAPAKSAYRTSFVHKPRKIVAKRPAYGRLAGLKPRFRGWYNCGSEFLHSL